MSTKKFKIEYIDPTTKEMCEFVEEFTDTPPMGIIPGFNDVELPRGIPAKEWAEDLAYSLADKGWHKVTEVVPT